MCKSCIERKSIPVPVPVPFLTPVPVTPAVSSAANLIVGDSISESLLSDQQEDHLHHNSPELAEEEKRTIFMTASFISDHKDNHAYPNAGKKETVITDECLLSTVHDVRVIPAVSSAANLILCDSINEPLSSDQQEDLFHHNPPDLVDKDNDVHHNSLTNDDNKEEADIVNECLLSTEPDLHLKS